MLKVEEITEIRTLVNRGGLSVRKASQLLKCSRPTVTKYLKEPDSKYRMKAPRPHPLLDQIAPRIDEILKEWSARTTPKQRITGSLVYKQLLKEGYNVGITLVREYLRRERRRKAEVFIPLPHYPGDEAQVDYFEVHVEVNGKRQKAWMFLMRLMYSGRDFVWFYEHCDQLSFLEGHVRAFEYFGAVPRRIVYDNLKAAVAKRVGVTIRLSERFRILTHHYGFEPCFARVGEGHDKGGVESRGKGIRLQHLTPIPQGNSLEEIIRKALSGLEEDAVTRRNKEGKNVMERFEEEKCHMTALATRPYDPREIVLKRVSNKSMVTLAGAHYSLPCHWAQSNVTAHVGVTDIHVVWKDEKEVLPRIPRGKEHIQYRHYLRELSRKPQAVRQVMPKLLRELGFPFDLYWSRLQVGTTELEAARVFARTLGLVLDHGEESVSRSLETMLKQEKLSLLEMGESLRAEEATVRVPVALCGYQIESARAADYDILLGGGQP